MTTLCNHCGFNNPPGMRFCGNCGTRLEPPAESGASPVVSFPEVDATSKVMMGGNLMDRLRQAGLDAAGQRRSVTVLFADLSGYTALSKQLDQEDIYFLIQDYITLLAESVYKFDGFVDKYIGDGLMALFGAPIAQENNAELAIRAAIDMQSGLEGLSQELEKRTGVRLQMRVGMHSGVVIVGGIGSDMMMDYTAIGDTVNLASRLEHAARPGTILVSESVYLQTSALFEFESLPPLVLKGIDHNVQAFQLTGARRVPGSLRGLEGLRPPMIGRENELSTLHTTLERLRLSRDGSFISITGEAGIGKSRLVSELKVKAQNYPVGVLEGHSLTYRRSVSYWIFRDLLRNALGLPPDPSETDVRLRLSNFLQKTLADEAEDAQPYIEYLMDLKPIQTSIANRMALLEADQLRRRTFLAVRYLLLALARKRPLLIILEDLHWVDDASLSLLSYLVDTIREAPIAIVGVSRPFRGGILQEACERAQQRLSTGYVEIQLQSLSLDDSELLLRHLLSNADMPDLLRQQILQRSAGNPFYMEEILRMLIDRRVICRENDTLQLVPGADLALTLHDVPETLQGLILTRFDELGNATRRALQVASAIGRVFSLQLLHTVIKPLDPKSLQEIISELVEREFILPIAGSTGVEYQFKHALVSDAIYSTLLKRDRNRLHGRIGEAIEALYSERLDEQVELLARHFAWSDRLDKALYYLVQAGQKSARSYINEQAYQHFQQAVEILPKVQHSSETELEVRLGLGDVLLFNGDYSGARNQYRSGLRLLKHLDPEQSVWSSSALTRKIATTFERQGDYDKALYYLENIQKLLAEKPDAYFLEQALVLNEIGWISFRRGDLENAETCLGRALELAGGSEQYDVIASIYNRLGGIYYQKEELERARLYVSKSLELREQLGDVAAVARSYNNLGLLDWKSGNWERALENMTRSYELHSALGDIEGSIELQGNIGLIQTERGNLQEARKHLEACLNSAEQIGHTYIQGMAFLHLSRFWQAARDWEKSLEYCKKSMHIMQELGAQESLIDLHVSMGEAHLGLGNMEEARSSSESANRLLGGNGYKGATPTVEQGRLQRLLGNLAREAGDYTEARQYMQASLEINRRSGNQLEVGRTLAALAVIEASLGYRDAAASYAQQAREIFDALGALLDLNSMGVMAI